MSRLAALLVAALLSGCHKSPETGPLRVGFFPNLTHAQALVGDAEGTFARALGGAFQGKRFNAGPEAMAALFAEELDASYVGSGPAVNAFVRSKGAVVVIAGSASGGASLVARHATSAAELRGKKVASPQLGNSQDIALRHWLRSQRLRPSGPGGGDVAVVPIPSADILNLFKRGDLEAAWVAEPWVARLVLEGGGHILVDERELWPGGKFPTTVLVASRRALGARRRELAALLSAHLDLTERGRAQPLLFAERANDAFERITRHRLTPEEVRQAFSRLELTVDPLEAQLAEAARHAAELGFLPSADIRGLVDRSLLDEALAARASP